jgi:hypothetical protein
MTTEEKIEIMQAYTAGETIQVFDKVWMDCKISPVWDWFNFKYRIKPREEDTLKGRIKRIYDDYEVVMLNWKKEDCHALRFLFLEDYQYEGEGDDGVEHMLAISLEGFEGYVYRAQYDNGMDRELMITNFTRSYQPVKAGDVDNHSTQFPVAVLFKK